MTAPLEDLLVVEGSAFVAAPLAGMTLGQLGADVIRFDPIKAASTSRGGRSTPPARASTGSVSTRANDRCASTSGASAAASWSTLCWRCTVPGAACS